MKKCRNCCLDLHQELWSRHQYGRFWFRRWDGRAGEDDCVDSGISGVPSGDGIFAAPGYHHTASTFYRRWAGRNPISSKKRPCLSLPSRCIIFPRDGGRSDFCRSSDGKYNDVDDGSICPGDRYCNSEFSGRGNHFHATAKSGNLKTRAFVYGTLSGIVEPVGAFLTILLTGLVVPLLPYLLSFAAGAMIYVVVEELIPEAQSGEHSNISTIGVAAGFVLMMILDVALG